MSRRPRSPRRQLTERFGARGGGFWAVSSRFTNVARPVLSGTDLPVINCLVEVGAASQWALPSGGQTLLEGNNVTLLPHHNMRLQNQQENARNLVFVLVAVAVVTSLVLAHEASKSMSTRVTCDDEEIQEETGTASAAPPRGTSTYAYTGSLRRKVSSRLTVPLLTHRAAEPTTNERLFPPLR